MKPGNEEASAATPCLTGCSGWRASWLLYPLPQWQNGCQICRLALLPPDPATHCGPVPRQHPASKDGGGSNSKGGLWNHRQCTRGPYKEATVTIPSSSERFWIERSPKWADHNQSMATGCLTVRKLLLTKLPTKF